MLDFKSILKMATNSLKINKMRSILTSLGIIIGVGSVIVMLAIGSGSSKKIASDFESMGSNLLMVRSASAKAGGIRMGAGTRPTLTLKDSEAIEKSARGVLAVAPYSAEGKQLTYGNQNWSTSVAGTTMPYLFIRNYNIESGRGFLPEDTKNGTKVTIIGQTVANELFGDVDPIGKTIRVGNIPFKVVGLLKAKGSSGMGQDQDDLIFIPITTAQRKVFGTDFPGTVNMITVKAQNENTLEVAQNDINEILIKRHNLGKNQDLDFEVKNLAETQETIKSATKTMSLFLLFIAIISLVVGGIGIMNIMLVSVTERTKEIGIRMAIGAKASDIRLQFLLESFLLSMFGGLVGVVGGIFIAYLIHALFGINILISLSSILISLGFSATVGILFGFWPAYKASLLNPIDALRYE